MTRIEKLHTIVDNWQAATIDTFWVDATTASMLVAVYDALKTDEAREKFERIPLMRLVDFGWKHVDVKT
jgi:hypothetical protein